MHTKYQLPLPVLAWLALAAIWGSTWLAVRVGVSQLPPFTFAGFRFVLAFVLMMPLLIWKRASIPRTRADWLLVGGTGALGLGASYGAQFWGMQYVSSGLAAVIFSTVPLFTIFFAHALVPGEPITRVKLMGVIVGIAGVAIIFADRLLSTDPLAVWGIAVFLVGAVAMAGAQVMIKARGTHIDGIVLATIHLGIAGVLLLSVGAIFEGNPMQHEWTRSALIAWVYLAVVGSALGFTIFYWLIRQVAVTKALSVMLTHPPVAIFLGWLVLGETLSWRALAGTAAVLVGLSLIFRRDRPTEVTRVSPSIERPREVAA